MEPILDYYLFGYLSSDNNTLYVNGEGSGVVMINL